MKIYDVCMKYLSISMIISFVSVLSFNVIKQKSEVVFAKSVTTHEEFLQVYESDIIKSRKKTSASISLFIQEHYFKSKEFSNKVSKIIVQESLLNNIDPYLVASIIGAESSFNENAKSYVGAVGLMQVMPFWKTENGLSFDRSKKDNLTNIYINLKYGCGIIAKYINDYDHNVIKALAAYNGSRGSLKYPNKIKRHHGIIAKFVYANSKEEINKFAI